MSVTREPVPMPLPTAPASRYASRLPVPLRLNAGGSTGGGTGGSAGQGASFLERYLLLFEAIWEPIERRQDAIEAYVDPLTCPASFLPWLAGWVAAEDRADWPEARRRRFLREAMRLTRDEGTARGVTRLLRAATGHEIRVEEGEDPFVIVVRIPDDLSREDRAELRAVLGAIKPAHVGYRLVPDGTLRADKDDGTEEDGR